MTEDTLLPFDLPAVSRKKLTADFAGESISSDGGLVLLRAADRQLGLAETLTGCVGEWRDPDRVVYALPAMRRFRMFAIACGFEHADDCYALRGDPPFKRAVGRAPESGRDLYSQPTISRLQNAPSRSDVPTPPCSACRPTASRPRDPDRRGDIPLERETVQPPTQTSTISNPGAKKSPNGSPCADKIRLYDRPVVNSAG